MLIKYNPERDKGKPLFELQTEIDGDNVSTVIVPVAVSDEIASLTPWLYLVEADDQDANT